MRQINSKNIKKDLTIFDINGSHTDHGTVMRTPSYGGYAVLWGFNEIFTGVMISDIDICGIFGIYLCFEI